MGTQQAKPKTENVSNVEPPEAAAQADGAKGTDVAALLEQVLANQAALEQRLEEERQARADAEAELVAAREAAQAGGNEAVLSRLTDVLEKLGDGAGGNGAGRTFAEGESAADVVRTLEGTVTSEDPDDDRLPRPVTFISKGANFVSTRKARHRFTTANGEAQVTTGITLDFAPAGMFVTDSRQNVEWLQSRPSYGKEFWEQGKEPHAAPSAAPVIEQITEAIVNFDDDALKKLRAAEVQGLNRGDIVTMIDSALERITNPEE